MQAVSINPTVASLTRVSGTQPAKATDRAPLRKDRRAPVSRLFVHTLRRSLAPGTRMQMDASTQTPMGPVRADVVLEADQRRVALLVGDAGSEREVMLLVYGGFDAIYRVSEQDARNQYLASVTLLESAERSLFASDKAHMAALMSVRRVHTGRTTLAAESWTGGIAATLHRRRLNRPGEWAAQFELALTAPESV